MIERNHEIRLEHPSPAQRLRFSGLTIEVTGIHPIFNAPVFVQDYDSSLKNNLFVFSQDIVPQNSFPITLVVNWEVGLNK